MTKKKIRELLKRKNIYNSWDFAGKGNVYITRHAQYSCFSAKWSINRNGFKTDPDAHWSDNYCKTFTIMCRSDVKSVLKKAQDWAGNRYNITDWSLNPFGDYMDTNFIKARLEELLNDQKTDCCNK